MMKLLAHVEGFDTADLEDAQALLDALNWLMVSRLTSLAVGISR